jgi:CRP/FNR family cyclic AMP-dependent transcriptional regulator
MRKVLFILGQLTDDDIAWLADVGAKRNLSAGEELIRAGEHPSAIYIVLDGHLRVTDETLGTLAELASGEIVGEMSFVDAAPPEASVVAGDDATVLAIDRRVLQAKLERDAAFGMRFYRALAIFMADRLRGTVRRLGYGKEGALREQTRLTDELDDAVMDTVSEAGDRFQRLLKTLATRDGRG